MISFFYGDFFKNKSLTETLSRSGLDIVRTIYLVLELLNCYAVANLYSSVKIVIDVNEKDDEVKTKKLHD